MILNHISWQIGNGLKANFWEDSWDGLPNIGDGPDLMALKQYFSQKWGTKVRDYLTLKQGALGNEWVWKDVVGEELSDEQIRCMKRLLQGRKIFISGNEDKLVWCGSSTGCYSVKIGYQLLNSLEREIFWAKDLCWNKHVLPKAGTFAWLAVKGRILTGDRQKRLGFAGPSKCVLCDKDEESVDHMLL